MLLLTDAQEYWRISKRYRQFKANPAMAGVACRDMDKILGDHGPAVRRRIIAFTTQHRPTSPSGGGGNSGPRRA